MIQSFYLLQCKKLFHPNSTYTFFIYIKYWTTLTIKKKSFVLNNPNKWGFQAQYPLSPIWMKPTETAFHVSNLDQEYTKTSNQTHPKSKNPSNSHV
jgi:hypothetical protein